MNLQLRLSVIALFLFSIFSYAQNITQVTSFGTNPGNLNMYTYIPAGLTGPAPLVVAMHGCTQSATIYAQQTGWNKLADLHKFYVIYPEQVSLNNSSKCFNWFDGTDQSKNQGEALSIKQMVDYMIANHSIDAAAICVTGLSAGAGMSSVMLATYPEIFSKGAIMAGIPYKAATSSFNAFTAMNGGVIKTPTQWGALVRNENPSYLGAFPDVAIFHGTSDFTVNVANATELIKQWTDVNGADQTADMTINSFDGNSIVEKAVYEDSIGNDVVVYYKITGMGHAISLDTGACPQQGGATGTYALEKNFHSTFWAADFFEILTAPYPISGPMLVVPSASNMVYTVPSTGGSTYAWTVPADATIVSGQGTNSITVNFGSGSGYISVIETTSGSCVQDAISLFVDVSVSSGMNNDGITETSGIIVFPNPFVTETSFYSGRELHNAELVVYDVLGKVQSRIKSVYGTRIQLYRGDLSKGIYFFEITEKDAIVGGGKIVVGE